MTRADDAAISFDPHDQRFLDVGVPFDVLRQIREREPVLKLAEDKWYVSRYEDVSNTLRDSDTFRADLGPITGIPAGLGEIPRDEHYLSEIQEPRHGEVRRLFNAVLARPRVRSIEPALREECARIISAFTEDEPVDFHDELAAVVPAYAMTRIMEVPHSDLEKFVRWSNDGTIMTRPSTPALGDGEPETYPYFIDLLERYENGTLEPTFLYGVFAEAEIEGEALTKTEIATQMHFMIQAGVHTTRGFLSHLLNRIVQDPEIYRTLKEDPTLISNFMEESLRRDSPVQRTTRRVTTAAEIDSKKLQAGDWVEVGIGSANHDELVFSDPDRFDLERSNSNKNVSFGSGKHVCPGAFLARTEGRIILETLLELTESIDEVDAEYPPMPGSLSHAPIPARISLRRNR